MNNLEYALKSAKQSNREYLTKFMQNLTTDERRLIAIIALENLPKDEIIQILRATSDKKHINETILRYAELKRMQ